MLWGDAVYGRKCAWSEQSSLAKTVQQHDINKCTLFYNSILFSVFCFEVTLFAIYIR